MRLSGTSELRLSEIKREPSFEVAGEADAIAAAEGAKADVTLLPEEVGEIFLEDEGDLGQVADGGDDAAGLELREEAGGEACAGAEFDKAHGALETEATDALANGFVIDGLLDFGCFYGVNLGFHCGCLRHCGLRVLRTPTRSRVSLSDANGWVTPRV